MVSSSRESGYSSRSLRPSRDGHGGQAVPDCLLPGVLLRGIAAVLRVVVEAPGLGAAPRPHRTQDVGWGGATENGLRPLAREGAGEAVVILLVLQQTLRFEPGGSIPLWSEESRAVGARASDDGWIWLD